MGSLLEYCHDAWRGKLEWCGYRTVKKIEYILFERDGQTDGQTDTT